jgi:hypothetical protein
MTTGSTRERSGPSTVTSRRIWFARFVNGSTSVRVGWTVIGTPFVAMPVMA